MGCCFPKHGREPVWSASRSLKQESANDIDGNLIKFSELLEGKKCTLVINIARKCRYTKKEYKGLLELYSKYKGHGFEILAFPSNEFWRGEPGTAQQTKTWNEK